MVSGREGTSFVQRERHAERSGTRASSSLIVRFEHVSSGGAVKRRARGQATRRHAYERRHGPYGAWWVASDLCDTLSLHWPFGAGWAPAGRCPRPGRAYRVAVG